MRAYEDAKRLLENKIREVTRQDELNNTNLEILQMAAHALKSIVTVMAMEDEGYSYDGGSTRRSYDSYDSYGSSYNGGRRGYSGRNNGRMMNRNSSYDNSYEGAKEDMINRLEDMLEMTQSKSDKSAIEKCIKQLEEADNS